MMIECPFCGKKDFDKIGLKYHLRNYCEEYENTPDVDNPCLGCEYRKQDEPMWNNICLLDENKSCVRELGKRRRL